MLFTSPVFFVFFFIYFCFHLIVPARFRIYLIICGSTIFPNFGRLRFSTNGMQNIAVYIAIAKLIDLTVIGICNSCTKQGTNDKSGTPIITEKQVVSAGDN